MIPRSINSAEQASQNQSAWVLMVEGRSVVPVLGLGRVRPQSAGQSALDQSGRKGRVPHAASGASELRFKLPSAGAVQRRRAMPGVRNQRGAECRLHAFGPPLLWPPPSCRPSCRLATQKPCAWTRCWNLVAPSECVPCNPRRWRTEPAQGTDDFQAAAAGPRRAPRRRIALRALTTIRCEGLQRACRLRMGRQRGGGVARGATGPGPHPTKRISP